MESMTEKDFLFPDVEEADAVQIMHPNVCQGCFHQKYDKIRIKTAAAIQEMTLNTYHPYPFRSKVANGCHDRQKQYFPIL